MTGALVRGPGRFQWFAKGVGLLFGLQFCRLKSLALATGEVAVLRKLRVLVHRAVHSYVNTLRMTAAASLDSCVVHRWFASPAPGIATPSESAYIPPNSFTACITITRSLQTVSRRVAAPAPNVLASISKNLVIFKVLLAVLRLWVGLAPIQRLFPTHNPKSHGRAEEPCH